MSERPFNSPLLNARQVIENITLKKIMLVYPETASYKSLIRFIHTGKTVKLNLTQLPADLAGKIHALFS